MYLTRSQDTNNNSEENEIRKLQPNLLVKKEILERITDQTR